MIDLFALESNWFLSPWFRAVSGAFSRCCWRRVVLSDGRHAARKLCQTVDVSNLERSSPDVVGNVTAVASIESFTGTSEGRFCPIDSSLNNAGGDGNAASFDQMGQIGTKFVDTNLKGVWGRVRRPRWRRMVAHNLMAPSSI